MPLPLRAEQVYLREEERAIFETAIGIARLRLRDGDLQRASDALDDACDEAHVRHFDACIEDGYSVEDVERFLGPRDRKVEGDAREIEARYSLVYVDPRPRVRLSKEAPEDERSVERLRTS